MNREITLAGFVVLSAALVALELAARRARRRHRVPRHLTFGEFVAVVQRSRFRWALLAGWLWLGWHVFARADWR